MEAVEIGNEESQHPAVESGQSLTSEQINEGAENRVEATAKLSEMNSKEAENPVDALAISPEIDADPLEASIKLAELNTEEAENPAISSSQPSELNNGEAEDLKVASAELSEMNNGEAENPKVASAELSEMNDGEPVNPVEASAKSTERNAAGVSGENSMKAESSKKRVVKSLKAKSVIKKKTAPKVPLDAEKVEGNPQTPQKNKKKNRRLSLKNRGNKIAQANNNNANASEENLAKDDAEIKPKGQSQESKDNQRKVSGPSSSQQNQTDENNRDGKGKRARRRKNKGKLDVKEDKQPNVKAEKQPDVKEDQKGKKKKKEKLGGLIFMCSAKTKPDCFRYQVMGVTSNKKDLVLGVRPGLKLFLYDFDLKLMYGVYKASSAGGTKLEPKAFGGSFPIQVRFSVHKDCVPLPESVFKKAIKDNYNGKNKFDIELSFQQVRKLIALFKPVGFQPTAAPAHLPSRAANRDREGERPRDSRPHKDNKSYPSRSHKRGREREREICRDKRPLQLEVLPTRREQPPRDLYMTEKEYRTYGLHRERRSLTPPRVSSSYRRDVERELHIRRPVSPYEPVPLHREPLLIDPVYPESRSYSRTALRSSGSAVTAMDSYTRDPYYSYPQSSHLLPSRREEVALDSYYDRRRDVYAGAVDPLRRRETEEMDMDRLYMKYSVDPPLDRRQVYRSSRPEDPLPPVSSRYSFSGPSVSYR